MSTELYIPTGCQTLDKVNEPQQRVGFQGFSGTGKTYAALTWPNPIIINIDRGLGAHFGRSDIVEVPMYRKDFAKKYCLGGNYVGIASLREAMYKWIMEEAPKIPENSTLIVDGGTGWQNAYHKWMTDNPTYSAGGQQNDFVPWRMKIEYFAELFEHFKSLKCNVIYLSHEAERPDKVKPGDAPTYSGKIRPLMTGQFGDQIVSHFTDWFRCHCDVKPSSLETLDEKKLAFWGFKDKKEFQAMLDSFEGSSYYYWQTRGDSNVECKASSLVNFPHFIPATYSNFRKFLKHEKKAGNLTAT